MGEKTGNTKMEISTTKKDAEKILAELNERIRGKNFATACAQDWFCELNGRIHALGWLTLIKTVKTGKAAGGKGIHCQLKLVDPDSDEAKEFL